jgi:hypothetical protein
VPFRREKIAEAIFRAAQSVGGEDRFLAEELAGLVAVETARMGARPGAVPTIEDVQDAVERVLIEAGHARTAKAYILYRNRRAQARTTREQLVSPSAGDHLVTSDGATVGRSGRGAGRARGGVPRADDAARGRSRASHVPDQTRPASLPQAARAAIEAFARGPHGHAGSSHSGSSHPSSNDLAPGWNKARITQVLTGQEGISEAEAEDVARIVEARILSSRLPRITPRLVRALIAAELFERGRACGLVEPARTGIDHAELDTALQGRLDDRRVRSPSTFAEGLGESLLARHLLEVKLPNELADAVVGGALHLYDPGAALRFSALTLDAVQLAGAELAGEGFRREDGPRRIIAALEEVVLRYAPHVSRVLALENINVLLAPYLDHLDEDALAGAVRHLLLSPILRFHGAAAGLGRGGLLQLELGLACHLPDDLVAQEVPPPAAPGRCYGDHADASRRVLRALLQERVALDREGHAIATRLTVSVRRADLDDADGRALMGLICVAASEIGEPALALEPEGEHTRGNRWFRLSDQDAPDPLRFPSGDVTALSTVAVNLVGAALRTRGAGRGDFLREVDRLLNWAFDLFDLRRQTFAQAAVSGMGALGPLTSGLHPLVDLESAHDLLELVGLDQAVSLLERRKGERARQALKRRILAHVRTRMVQEATARRSLVALAQGLSPEAAERFAAHDRARYPEIRSWWDDGAHPSYQPPPALGRRVEGAGAPARLTRGPRTRVRLRVDPERLPSWSEMRAVLESAWEEQGAWEFRLEPWPRRRVRFVRGAGGPA